jgi:hypothetical protein
LGIWKKEDSNGFNTSLRDLKSINVYKTPGTSPQAGDQFQLLLANQPPLPKYRTSHGRREDSNGFKQLVWCD